MTDPYFIFAILPVCAVPVLYLYWWLEDIKADWRHKNNGRKLLTHKRTICDNTD